MQLSRRLKKRSTCRIDFNRNRQPRQRVDRTSHFGDLSKFLSTCHSRSSTICSNLGSATSSKSSIPLRHTSACCQESPLEYISRLAKIVQKTFSNVTARQVTMVSPRAPLQHFAYTGGLFSSQMRVFKHCPVAVSQMRLRKKWAQRRLYRPSMAQVPHANNLSLRVVSRTRAHHSCWMRSRYHPC